jgi:hypothetical protein
VSLEDIVITVAISIATSLFSWWLVTQAIGPKVTVSQIRHSTKNGKQRYELDLNNVRRCSAATDVHVSVSFRARSTDGGRWAVVPIPIGTNDLLPYLEKGWNIRLHLDEIEPRFYSYFLKTVQNQLKSGDTCLEEMFAQYPNGAAMIRVTIRATHSYTNATRTSVFELKEIPPD